MLLPKVLLSALDTDPLRAVPIPLPTAAESEVGSIPDKLLWIELDTELDIDVLIAVPIPCANDPESVENPCENPLPTPCTNAFCTDVVNALWMPLCTAVENVDPKACVIDGPIAEVIEDISEVVSPLLNEPEAVVNALDSPEVNAVWMPCWIGVVRAPAMPCGTAWAMALETDVPNCDSNADSTEELTVLDND